MVDKKLMGNMKIRTKIILPTIIVLVMTNLVSVFTSAYKMDDLAKSNAKVALNQLTDSIFLNLRTAMNTGDLTIIEDTEEKARNNIQGLERFVVAKNHKVINLFTPTDKFTTDKEVLKVMASKKNKLIEFNKDNKHLLRSLRPMIATNECLYCHVNQKVGDVIGVLDLTFNLEESDKIINSTVTNLVWQAIVVLTLITIFMTWLIKKATKPIDVFQKGLEMFFRYINKEEKEVGYIDGYSNDEIGELVASVNKNIDATVAGVEQDAKVIEEAKEVCKQASLGIFDVEIKSIAHSPELNELRDLVNNLISATGYNVKRIFNVLTSYENNDYIDRINSTGKTTGIMKDVFNKVDLLGNSLSNNAKENLMNGKKLKNDAHNLNDAVAQIQSYLDNQSKNLDNAVDELGQITQAITDTTNNSISMAEYAKNVTSSVQTGEKLANQTSTEMDEIVEQVNSINEAITIIDQIAFQTNILSLNAAVEAATAGEAGKGFAVVAQEVRNLANRSADAAKDIKNLVESATLKATEGKVISDKMKDGYNSLNEHISATINLIDEVAKASKNQQGSIEHINASINDIQEHTNQSRQMTQDAALIATETDNLASKIVEEASTKKFN